MTRPDIPTAASLPSALELHLSSLVRSTTPFTAIDVAGWARDENQLCASAFAAWCRAVLDTGEEVEGPVRSVALHFAALPPGADLTAVRMETVAAYLDGELGTGRPAASAFVSILDLVHLAALSRPN